jgi:hypothetical protein
MIDVGRLDFGTRIENDLIPTKMAPHRAQSHESATVNGNPEKRHRALLKPSTAPPSYFREQHCFSL